MDVVKLILPNRNQIQFQIALVDEPAIESDFMTFNSQNHFQFKEVDKNERLLMGYFMIADMEILRIDAKRGAYKVVFPKESIDSIIENFQLNGLANNMNEMHQSGKLIEGVFVRNHWQIDSKKGIKAPDGFKTEADGSWFGVVKCENDEVYQKALNGTFRGFSIEGKFIEEAIDKYCSEKNIPVKTDKSNFNLLYKKFKDMKFDLKEFGEAIVAFFASEDKAHKFEELLLVDGTTKVTIEPEVAVGSAIALYDTEGNPIPAPIGSYELQDGRVIVVEVDGVIASITEATTEEEELDADGKPKVKSDNPAPQNEAVKRLIERIEKVSEFEKQIADLQKENTEIKLQAETFKKESEFLHKENDEMKTKFADFEKLITDNFAKLMAKESKEPVVPVKTGFKMEKKESIYPAWMKPKVN